MNELFSSVDVEYKLFEVAYTDLFIVVNIIIIIY